MFDLSWGEMGIIAVVALVVLGPKELPNALRTVSGLMKNARKLANEFQSGVNEIIREADLEEARKKLAEVNKNSIQDAITKAVDPSGEVKSALQDAAKEANQLPVDPTGPAVAAPTEDVAVEIAAAAGEAPTLPPSATPASTPEPESPDNTPAPEPVGATKS
jgi:sec-independent protein translocase protein TatB